METIILHQHLKFELKVSTFGVDASSKSKTGKGGAMLLSLCDADREFGICILT